jgi:hypothetical protein
MALPPSKLGPSRKISIIKIARPKAKYGPQGASEIELDLTNSIGVSYGLHAGGLAVTHIERTARVPAFHNLSNDSSPDVRKTPLPKKTEKKCASLPPLVSGEFLPFHFTLLPHALMTMLHVLPNFRLRWICRWRVWTKTWNAACSV